MGTQGPEGAPGRGCGGSAGGAPGPGGTGPGAESSPRRAGKSETREAVGGWEGIRGVGGLVRTWVTGEGSWSLESGARLPARAPAAARAPPHLPRLLGPRPGVFAARPGRGAGGGRSAEGARAAPPPGLRLPLPRCPRAGRNRGEVTLARRDGESPRDTPPRRPAPLSAPTHAADSGASRAPRHAAPWKACWGPEGQGLREARRTVWREGDHGLK